MFKDFKLSGKADSGMLIFLAKGRKEGIFNPEDTFSTNVWLNFAFHLVINNPGEFYALDGKSGRPKVKFQQVDDSPKYLVISVAGGAFAWDITSPADQNFDKRIELVKEQLYNYLLSSSGRSEITPLSEQ